MSTALLVTIIVVAVVVVAAVAALAARSSSGRGKLRRRFGPEYDRTVERHGGDTTAAEKELRDRLDAHGGIELKPLSSADRDRWNAEWNAVQQRFVDSPSQALAQADELLSRLARERGLPDSAFDEQADALSVHLPRQVQAFRDTHAAARQGEDDQVPTEKLRAALVRARGVFDELTGGQARTDAAEVPSGTPSGVATGDSAAPAARTEDTPDETGNTERRSRWSLHTPHRGNA
jgi:hypothetical protein